MKNLRINGRIWLETQSSDATERFMGIGRMELLGHIQRTGSINQAAKAMRMSYKRAGSWPGCRHGLKPGVTANFPSLFSDKHNDSLSFAGNNVLKQNTDPLSA